MPETTMDTHTGAVYVQTNDPAANSAIAFRRDGDGTLTRLGAYRTGGAGDGVAHLTSQGSVVLTGDGTRLLVSNAGSGDISVFAVSSDGLALAQTVATGATPKSVAEHDGLVYVLNTGDPSLTGFRLAGDGLVPVAGSRRELAAGADPAQVGFSRDGSVLVVTQRGTNSIASYPVDAAGLLGAPSTLPSSGPTPYGFAFTSTGTLVVTEAFGAQVGKAAASSYRLGQGSMTPVTRSAGNGRSEICWAVVSKDERYAFTTNFADGAVSRYAIGADGSLTLEDATAATAVDGHTGLRDEDVTGDGRFLYAIDADTQRIFGWAVGDRGALAPIGSWRDIPETVAGIAAS
jgi:6-phosphogluconolactonase (cycloisomerase 2 family)